MINRQRLHSRDNRRRPRLLARLCAMFLLVFLDCRALTADTNTERRIAVGMKLFSVLLAADQQVDSKVNGKGRLPVGVLYANDQKTAERTAESLSLSTIRDIPVQLSVLSLESYLANKQKYFGVFVAQRLSAEELQALIGKAREEGAILFSPFAGDVEQGVLGGISVQASVRPYINRQALQRSGLDIKPFFLKVAKIHE